MGVYFIFCICSKKKKIKNKKKEESSSRKKKIEDEKEEKSKNRVVSCIAFEFNKMLEENKKVVSVVA